MAAISTGGSVELEFPDGEVPSVARVLDALAVQQPHLTYRIRDADGALERFVNVFVGRDNVNRCDGLATRVPPGAEVWIVPPGAGG